MFARILSKAQQLESQVRNRQIEKEYICKVQGEFPSEDVLCEESIVVVSHKIGVCRVSRDGKPCKTLFKRISYDGITSIVKCVPHTGRMHQIRVHLQWLGYPIINDPIYNHESWGPLRGRHGVSDQLVYKVISELAKSPTIMNINNANFNDAKSEKETQTSTYGLIKKAGSSEFEETNISNKDESVEHKSFGAHVMNSSDNGDCLNKDSQCCTDTTGQYYDKDCSECKIIRRDPTPTELTMCLHAVSYKGPDWEFKTGLPKWAKEEEETSSPLISEKFSE